MIRRSMAWALFVGVGAAGSAAWASNVLVLSSGNAALDALVRVKLESSGHTVVIGPQFTAFTPSQSLAGFDVVYFQANDNWNSGDMPIAGQTALRDWINAGGGMVTGEWVTYITAAGRLQTLRASFAVTPNSAYRSTTSATYTRITSNPVIDQGLPSSFQIPLTDYTGTEARLVPRVGATAFYSTAAFPQGPASGVVGAAFGSGRVVHLSTTCGPDQLNDPEGSRLLGNVVSWAGRGRTVLVLSSSVAPLDTQARTILEARGFEVTIGPEFSAFTGAPDLDGYRAVYLQANDNWPNPDMPAAGQMALRDWVQAGGGLVTSEWVGYLAESGARFQLLAPVLPAESDLSFRTTASTYYQIRTPDPILRANLPNELSFNLTSYGGTETHLAPKPGATQFYVTAPFPNGKAAGVVGWDHGSGRVLSFSTTCGPAQLSSALFATLFGNAMNWVTAGAPPSCYSNCDGSTTVPVLNVNDFICFQSRFAAGDPFADCDHSGGLNVNDFICFQGAFAAGCP